MISNYGTDFILMKGDSLCESIQITTIKKTENFICVLIEECRKTKVWRETQTEKILHDCL